MHRTDRPAVSVEGAYDRWAGTYDTDENATRDLDAVVLRRLLPPLAGSSVLELGAGTGKNTRALAEARCVIAVDFSAGMLVRARARLAHAPGTTLLRADLRRPLPIAAASVDLVLIDLVLEHVEAVDPVMAEVARVLRPGGRAIVIELHPFRQQIGKQAHFHDPDTGLRVDVPVHVHSVSQLVQAGLLAGLRLENLGEWREDCPVDPLAPPRLLSLVVRREA